MHSSFDPDGAGADLGEAIAVPGNGQLHQPGRAAGLPLGVLELENDDLEAAQVCHDRVRDLMGGKRRDEQH